MILKRTILIIVGLFIKTVVLSQGKNDSNAMPNIKDSLRVDTIEIRVKKIAFIAKDTVFDGFITIDTLGIFHAFASQERLDNYIQAVSEVFFYQDDEILGTGNYISVFKTAADTDTIRSYRNVKIEYYDGNKLKTDNLGVPILEYDLEHSYILQQMNQNTSGQYIYCLINEGTMRFYGIHPTNYLKSSLLLKVDTTQDTTYNFFMYRAQSKSYQGMRFVAQDSVIMPLRKLRRKRWVYSNMGELLTSKRGSDVYSNNYERTYVLIVKEERYVISATTEFNKKVDRWVALVESISIMFEQLQEKLFQ